MVLNAAWPVLANAKPSAPPSEICSATGLSHAAGGTPAGKGLHASHCSLCPFHAERGLPIADVGQALIASDPPVPQIFARGDEPRPGIALHPAAPPRAPPLLS